MVDADKKVKQIKRKLTLEAKTHKAENQLCLVPSTHRIVKYRKIFVSRVFEGFFVGNVYTWAFPYSTS